MDSSLAGDLTLLAAAALLTTGALLSRFAERYRAPGLLLFLALGMLIGDDGLGLISFDDAELAQGLGVLALVIILFEGGLSTSLADARRVAAPASLLATAGVTITAVIVGVAVVATTDTSTTTAALIGAVVASTDAAAVFAALRRAPVRRRLSSLLEAESGGNDPMAVFLTIGILASWDTDPGALDWVLFGLRQLLGGLAVGLTVGSIAAWTLRRVPSDSTTFHPVLSLGAAGLAYGLGALLGASGFLAVFVAALLVGAAAPRHRRAIRRFHEGLANVAQIALFLMLGLLVFPSQLVDVIGIGLLAALVLIVVARPVAVAICLPWFGFERREVGLVAWAGLRGAVPIVLATFPLTAGYPDGALVFDVVFFVVLTSALIQGLTIAPLARRLGLEPEGGRREVIADLVPIDAVGIDVIEVELDAHHDVVGRCLRDVPLPGRSRVGAVLRDQEVEVPDGDTVLAAGDLLIVVAPSDDRLADRLTDWASARQAPAEGDGPPDDGVDRPPERRRPERAD
jgi:cell volume regulation protein A